MMITSLQLPSYLSCRYWLPSSTTMNIICIYFGKARLCFQWITPHCSRKNNGIILGAIIAVDISSFFNSCTEGFIHPKLMAHLWDLFSEIYCWNVIIKVFGKKLYRYCLGMFTNLYRLNKCNN